VKLGHHRWFEPQPHGDELFKNFIMIEKILLIPKQPPHDQIFQHPTSTSFTLNTQNVHHHLLGIRTHNLMLYAIPYHYTTQLFVTIDRILFINTNIFKSYMKFLDADIISNKNISVKNLK